MSTVTKYIMVKEEIKKWILEGRITPKHKIGSENELMKVFEVSRHTIRQAIGELVNEGWLYREHGVGTFCADRLNDQNEIEDKTIAVICTYISDYIFPTIIRGAETYLSNRGYSILLSSTNNDVEKERQCLHHILSKNIAGLIIEPTKSALYSPNIGYYLNMERSGIPYLMINASYSGINPPSITLDDELGGFLAAEHLIQLGHKRIMGIFKTDDLQGMNRMKGFLRAYQQYDLPIHPELLISYNTEEKAVKPIIAARRLLELSGERPTAICCYNDEIAVHILNIIRDLDLSVPKHISLVGFDDSQLAVATEVKLTTIRHPKSELGELAARLMIDMVEKNKSFSSSNSLIYEPKLIVRNSTSRPPT